MKKFVIALLLCATLSDLAYGSGTPKIHLDRPPQKEKQRPVFAFEFSPQDLIFLFRQLRKRLGLWILGGLAEPPDTVR